MPIRRPLDLPLLTLAVLCPLAASSLSAQSYVRWDTAQLDQAGQRSLFLRTTSGGNFGLPLGAGDVNGDGREDVMLCAFAAAEAHLFFSPPVNAGQQEAIPQPGVVTRIFGAQSLGVECAAGDVNGDGLADLILGAPNATVSGRMGTGIVYVVFGTTALPASVDVRSTPGVLAIAGVDALDHFGVWVDAVDVDGDGVDDLLVGAPDADGPANDREGAGEAYVIFGGADLTAGAAELVTLRATGRVFTVYGADADDKTGSALDAGRIDDDGVADLVVGSGLDRAAIAVFGGSVGGGDGPDEDRENAGEAAVVFDPTRGGSVDLANPPGDVTIVYGADPQDFAGEEVNVGDADGDGFGDVMVGALAADGPDNLRPTAGEAYLIYGGPGLRGQRIDLRQPPDGVTVIYGPTAGGITGDTARFIDIDGDGRSDVFVGSPSGIFTGPDGRSRTGALFFVRSPAGHLPAVIDLDQPPLATLPFGVILAADPGDILSYSLVRASVDGDGAEDVVVNGMTGDGFNNMFVDAGEAYVLSGAALAAAMVPFASGDLDGDGRSDVVDLQRAIAGLAGQVELSEAERRAADTNGNGALDVGDLVGLVDRVLNRNSLVPGALGREGLSKDAAQPLYRYETRMASSDFSLARPAPAALGPTSPAGAAPGSSLPIHAVEVVLAVPGGSLIPPRVVPGPAGTVVAHVSGDELRVIVLSSSALPLNVPLFEVVGSVAPIRGITAATGGGSLRRLVRVPPPVLVKGGDAQAARER